MVELLTVETNKNIVLEKTQEAKNYSESASNSAQTASEQANIAVANATIATEKANYSKIWAEGTDEEVKALGGVHSSKVWANLGGLGGVWGEISGNISAQKDLQALLGTYALKTEIPTDFYSKSQTDTKLETKQDTLNIAEISGGNW